MQQKNLYQMLYIDCAYFYLYLVHPQIVDALFKAPRLILTGWLLLTLLFCTLYKYAQPLQPIRQDGPVADPLLSGCRICPFFFFQSHDYRIFGESEPLEDKDYM